jgi:cytochrome c oxidase subunit III
MSSDSHAAHAEEHEHPPFLAHHFDTPVQQFDAAKLGVWAFLAQEILFFSGLFCAYAIFRAWHPEAFSVGSHLLNWKWGALNTFVLLISSFTAAQAVRYSQIGDRSKTSLMLVLTILCAIGFMVVKYIEYTHKIHVGILPGRHFAPTAEGIEEVRHAVNVAHAMQDIPEAMRGAPYHLRSFFGIYFVMTGLHGLHVVIGIGIMAWVLLRNMRGEFSAKFFTPVDLAALYWHLVDLIWIFLFPLVYLID